VSLQVFLFSEELISENIPDIPVWGRCYSVQSNQVGFRLVLLYQLALDDSLKKTCGQLPSLITQAKFVICLEFLHHKVIYFIINHPLNVLWNIKDVY
jgi:hypothetical protein